MDASDEKKICDFFNIDSLFQNQKFAIKNILDKKDVLISTKTSSGKSLCYQALPVLTRSSVLVFSPLISIMEDQVSFLNRLGLNSTSIGKDTKDDDRVKKGDFDVMFTSPETVLGNEMWRDVLMCSQFRQRLCAIVVDEAHTVVQWGEGTKNSDPFREWFGKIGEVRSLCPGVPFLVLTATASKRTRQAIEKKLCMDLPVEIVECPDRDNIKLNVKVEKSSLEVEVMFQWLLCALEEQNETLPRHIVFCKTIRDSAKLYTMFRLCLPACMEYVQMFHSCTPKAVKDLIIEDMKSVDGKFRILICTNAAGMGVNFHGVNHVVNFGPPHEMDTFVQQIGRGGRSGEQAYHLLLTTKQQLRHTDQELREYALNDKRCRRDVLLTNYTLENRASVVPHSCCDICVCNCESIDCSSERFVHLAHRFTKEDSDTDDSDYCDCMEEDDSDCTDLYEYDLEDQIMDTDSE